jgi:hypothetical protein
MVLRKRRNLVSRTISLNNRSDYFQQYLYQQDAPRRTGLIAAEKRYAAAHSAYLASCEETHKDALHGYEDSPAGRSRPMFVGSALRWFSSEQAPSLTLSAEAALWLAVVEQGIRDVLTGDEEAAEWFHSAERGVGSLNWICTEVGLGVDAVRREVLRRINVKARAAA